MAAYTTRTDLEREIADWTAGDERSPEQRREQILAAFERYCEACEFLTAARWGVDNGAIALLDRQPVDWLRASDAEWYASDWRK